MSIIVADRLKGRRAVVTGGSRGIGRAIVDRLAAEGARVLTCGRGERPGDLDAQIDWTTANVADPESVASLRDAAMARLGGIDILVNNAGVQIEKTIIESTDADWDLIEGINMRGVFLCCRTFIPAMTASGGGAIVNIGSTSGFAADPGLALYNASKAFVHGLTRSIAVDHGAAGIRCNAVCPGWIITGIAESAFAMSRNPEAARQDALRRHPIGRFGKPEDIAGAVAWLVSEDASFATGQTYIVDGGILAAAPVQTSLF
jgi:meso-butanediol dehydrogenase/(S,S)-butanediol dehydrogenase/diacetyl reductase